MKAWIDLEMREESMPCTTSFSSYYIEDGIKIERFNDGTFKIYTIITGNEFFSEITSEQYRTFYDRGWIEGVCKVNIERYKYLISRIDKLKLDDGFISDNLSDLKSQYESLLEEYKLKQSTI